MRSKGKGCLERESFTQEGKTDRIQVVILIHLDATVTEPPTLVYSQEVPFLSLDHSRVALHHLLLTENLAGRESQKPALAGVRAMVPVGCCPFPGSAWPG
jgi:hypothetical protein